MVVKMDGCYDIRQSARLRRCDILLKALISVIEQIQKQCHWHEDNDGNHP